jgi:hypothetical protein
MGFQCHRDPVAEPALCAVAQHLEKPGGGGGGAESDGCANHEAMPPLEHAIGQQLHPQREQRVRQGGKQRQRE